MLRNAIDEENHQIYRTLLVQGKRGQNQKRMLPNMGRSRRRKNSVTFFFTEHFMFELKKAKLVNDIPF